MTPDEIYKLKKAIVAWLEYSGWFIMSAMFWMGAVAAKANNNIPEKCRSGASDGYCFDDMRGAFNMHMFTHWGIGIAILIVLIPTIAWIVNRVALAGRERAGLTPEARRARERKRKAELEAAQDQAARDMARIRELEDYCGLEPLDAVPRGVLNFRS